MKHIYLDTSRIRDLANNRDVKYWKDIDDVLRAGDCSLVLSDWHLLEFSRGSITKDATVGYLDTLPSPSRKWAIQSYNMWKREVAAALDFVLTNKNLCAIQIFQDSFIDTLHPKQKRKLQYNLQPFSIVRLLEVCKKFKMSLTLDQRMQKDINMIKKLKENAAVWRNWRAVLYSHIRAYWPTQTKAGLIIKPIKSQITTMVEMAEKILPSLTFAVRLQRVKFSSSEGVERNDLYDEYHACYAPYCDVIMHDEDTCRRVKKTGSTYASKFASTPAEFLKIFATIL